MPPPLAVALFPLTVERRRTMSPSTSAAMPPPLPLVTRLPEIVEFCTVMRADGMDAAAPGDGGVVLDMDVVEVQDAAGGDVCAATVGRLAAPQGQAGEDRAALAGDLDDAALPTGIDDRRPRARALAAGRPAPRIRTVRSCSAPRVSR